MYINLAKPQIDPENPLLPCAADAFAQKRFGRSFKQFDLRHLRQVGTDNLPKELRIASEFIRDASESSKKSGMSVLL